MVFCSLGYFDSLLFNLLILMTVRSFWIIDFNCFVSVSSSPLVVFLAPAGPVAGSSEFASFESYP